MVPVTTKSYTFDLQKEVCPSLQRALFSLGEMLKPPGGALWLWGCVLSATGCCPLALTASVVSSGPGAESHGIF